MLPKKKLIKLLKYLGEASFIFVLIAKFALLILWEIRSLNIQYKSNINYLTQQQIMSNWTDYVMNYAAKHGISYGEALKKAAPSYRKKGGVVVGGRKKRRSTSKSRMVGGVRKKKRSTSKSRMVGGVRKRRSTSKARMVGGRRRPASGSKTSRRVVGGKMEKKAYRLGRDLGQVFGGKRPKKAALAALLTGLNSR